MPGVRSAALVLFGVSAVAAQDPPARGSLSGVVWRDSARTALSAAQIAVPALGRETSTSEQGNFRLDAMPVGRFLVTVRAMGYEPRVDTVDIVNGVTTARTYSLVAITYLDTVSVKAEKAYSSIASRKLANRRSSGVGHYISEQDLREQDGRTLAQVILRKIPGLRVVPSGSGTYFASSRTISERARGNCFVTVYLDGSVFFDGSTRAVPVPNFDRWEAHDFAAIEFYGAATAPPEFRRTPTACGVLLLWTREGGRD